MESGERSGVRATRSACDFFFSQPPIFEFDDNVCVSIRLYLQIHIATHDEEVFSSGFSSILDCNSNPREKTFGLGN